MEKTDIIIHQQEDVKQVYLSYLKWFIGACFLACLGTIGADSLNTLFHFSGFQIKILRIFSLVLEASSLGQSGWSIQTWRGDSPAEKLNQKLFVLFSATGFFLVIFSFQIE